MSCYDKNKLVDGRLKMNVFSTAVESTRQRPHKHYSCSYSFNMTNTCHSYAPKAYIPAPNVPGNGPQLLGCMFPYSPAPESEGMDCPNYIFNYPRLG